MGRTSMSTAAELRPLPEREEAVLLSLAMHRLLAFSQVRRLHFTDLSAPPARRALARLERRHLAGHFIEATPIGRESVWYATTEGFEVAAATWPEIRKPRAGSVGARKLDHTIAVNEFCTRLVGEARERGHTFGPADWRNEEALKLPGGRLLVADAFIVYGFAGRWALRFLEMDLGTMPAMAVEEKYLRYVSLFRSGGWRRDYLRIPKVATVVGGRNQSERLDRLVCAATLARGRDGEPDLLFATADDVAGSGPLTDIWQWAGSEKRKAFLK